MQFTILERGQRYPSTGKSAAFLRIDQWNDFSFVTMFEVLLFDESGTPHDLGSIKIGFKGQTIDTPTHKALPLTFDRLNENFFSIGQDVKFYRVLCENTSNILQSEFLQSLNDVALNEHFFEVAKNEEVFKTSLLRHVSVSIIEGQYRRVIHGGAPLTPFNFEFSIPQTEEYAGICLQFNVTPNSQPSTNIHCVIGRNGVGKTTLLNSMISAITRQSITNARFLDMSNFIAEPISESYFSSLVSVAFSAFDPFIPPPENLDPGLGTRYTYIGLKDTEDETGVKLKTITILRRECIASIGECLGDPGRKTRWITAIRTLESDENFASMDLTRLAEREGDHFHKTAEKLLTKMSSGHAIVLLTISKLVARVQEKTLVLIDEPESHLHPPLLAAFARALSELLNNRNGLAIIATHSPVVLQEIPRMCAIVLTRSHLSMHSERPQIETFGENVGSLTREVFGLEVTRSGYHSLLQSAVATGKSYEAIISSYNNQIGLEARGILRAMIADRDDHGAIS